MYFRVWTIAGLYSNCLFTNSRVINVELREYPRNHRKHRKFHGKRVWTLCVWVHYQEQSTWSMQTLFLTYTRVYPYTDLLTCI